MRKSYAYVINDRGYIKAFTSLGKTVDYVKENYSGGYVDGEQVDKLGPGRLESQFKEIGYLSLDFEDNEVVHVERTLLR